MQTLLPTETIVVFLPVEGATNDFGEAVLSFPEEGVEVTGCLIQPGASSELGPLTLELLQKELLTIHLPKTFKSDCKNAKVIVRGQEYEVLAAFLPVTSSPLPWDRQLLCAGVR